VETSLSEATPRDLIWKHIRAIRTCMMVTHDGAQVRARPMRGIPREDENAIWFFSNAETQKDFELRENPEACLTFSDVKGNTYVSVTGRISRIEERGTVLDLWNDGADSYFSQGPDDPRVVLLRFDPETGEFWDCPSGPIVLAIKFLESKITGTLPDLGSNGKARL
jgi:general stress protein 26